MLVVLCFLGIINYVSARMLNTKKMSSSSSNGWFNFLRPTVPTAAKAAAVIEIVQPFYDVGFGSVAVSNSNNPQIERVQIWSDFETPADANCEFDILTNETSTGKYVSVLSKPFTLSDVKPGVMTDVTSYLERSRTPILTRDSVLIVNKTPSVTGATPSCPSVVLISVRG